MSCLVVLEQKMKFGHSITMSLNAADYQTHDLGFLTVELFMYYFTTKPPVAQWFVRTFEHFLTLLNPNLIFIYIIPVVYESFHYF